MRKPEPPERVQITVDVAPKETKRRSGVDPPSGRAYRSRKFWSSRRRTRSAWCSRTLKPEHREAYRAGTLDLDVAFPPGSGSAGAEDVDRPDEEVVVSAKITVEARTQLDLYSRLARMPLAVVIEKLATSMERRLKKRLEDDERDPEPTLDPDFARCMEPMAEDA